MTDIAAKLKFLSSPAAYGHSGAKVQCIETHMSWVFLVGQQVFKLKKTVRFPFLDFSTLMAREFYCREEVRLNARLAPGIYLGVVALKCTHGTFSLAADGQQPTAGETVDWLVCMRRLPEASMLSQRLASQHLRPTELEPLARILGNFYKNASKAALDGEGYLSRFSHEQALNRAVLLRPPFQLQRAEQALAQVTYALQQCADLLRERVAGQRVVDGHGDLRPEHVCLLTPPVVIDCLEFNAAFRQVDPLDEILQLGLECALAGAPWVGPYLMAALGRLLGAPPTKLINFYTAQRALVRARLAMAHLLDENPRSPEKWPPLAERYITLAIHSSDKSC